MHWRRGWQPTPVFLPGDIVIRIVYINGVTLYLLLCSFNRNVLCTSIAPIWEINKIKGGIVDSSTCCLCVSPCDFTQLGVKD